MINWFPGHMSKSLREIEEFNEENIRNDIIIFFIIIILAIF